MTVVRPNSIAGINSITVQTGQALNIHDASGNLIRSLTNSSGVSTFSSINVTQGSGDLIVGISTLVVDNSAGKIGIGTVPARTLQVFAATPQVNLKSASGGNCELQFGDTGDEVRANIIYNSSSNYLGFNGYNNTERLRITSAGLVGINSTIPRSKLHVANGNSAYNPGNPTGLGAGAVACLESSSDVALQFLSSTSTDNYIYFGDTSSATTGSIQYDHSSDALSFNVNGGTERCRIDSSGRLLIGGTSSTTVWGYGQGSLQVIGDYQGGSASFINNEANTNSQAITLGKTRNGGIVSNNDTCGALVFSADDGNGYSPCSRIMGQVDGTPGDGDMPGRMVFETTADGSASLTERLRISSDGSSVFEVAATEVDIKGTGSGDRFPLRLFNSDTTSTNMTGIYFGPCNNVAGAYVAGKAEADFTSTANRDAGLEFGTRLDGNWKEAMKISAAGYVTKPLHPICQRGNNTAKDGSVIEYDYAVIDQGSNWDSTNHRFTAPITGIYFVGLYGMSSTSQGTMDVQIKKNGSDYHAIVPYSAMAAHQYHHFCAVGTISLAANDYVSVSQTSGDMYSNNNGRHGGLTIYLIG